MVVLAVVILLVLLTVVMVRGSVDVVLSSWYFSSENKLNVLDKAERKAETKIWKHFERGKKAHPDTLAPLEAPACRCSTSPLTYVRRARFCQGFLWMCFHVGMY